MSFVSLLYIFHCLSCFQYRLKEHRILDCRTLISLGIFHLSFVTNVYMNDFINLFSFGASVYVPSI